MKKTLFALFVMLFLGWGATRIIMNIQFDRNCEGYLKRAADANNVPLALIQLEMALKYIEANKLTEGSTHILYSTPDLDLGFWYSNLKDANENLKKLETDKLSSLEESNTLMKLRETLLDHSSEGDTVTIPEGISVYPYNVLFCIWGLLSFCLALFIGILIRED